MTKRLDLEKIARGLGAERRGKIDASGAILARYSFWPGSKLGSACLRVEAGPRIPVGPNGVSFRSRRAR